ncbi:MAG: hypothetical protein K2J10_05510 [Muribaculaceae bacterium]|nr:hypothetical protein [Muribaculaceae bacterium]
MKIIIKIFVVLGLLLILKDCLGLFYTKMTHLSNSDLEWIKTGDALFESSSMKSAKLTNMGSYLYNETNPFYISSAGDGQYEANGGYHYVLCQDGVEIEGCFAIHRSIDDDSLEFKMRLNRLSTGDYKAFKSKSIEINGHHFKDCLVIDSTNSEYLAQYYPEADLKISKFIINKKYGLLYYELENGEKFYRKFKTIRID